MIKNRFPDVRLITLPENLGFSAGINRGVDASSAEVVVLLNNDANAEPGFLDAISRPFIDDGVGMVAGVLVVPGANIVDSAGVEIDRGLANFAYMGGSGVEKLKTPRQGLIGPSGGAAAFRRQAFEEVGGFDEAIFAYGEDLDLSLRLRANGWSCAFAPDARAIHVGSTTLGLRTVSQVAIASRSRGYMLGRYRIGPLWTITELVIGFVDCFLLHSTAPLVERMLGIHHGRKLPQRTADRSVIVGAMGWLASLRRRFEVTRAYERRHAR